VQIWDHPTAGKIQQAAPAARFEKTPAAFTPAASLRGQDNHAILAEMGKTPEQIAALEAAGTIGT